MLTHFISTAKYTSTNQIYTNPVQEVSLWGDQLRSKDSGSASTVQYSRWTESKLNLL